MAAANKPETIQNVLTPAFLVDIDKAKRNAQKMVNICERLGVQLRPHMKTHKTVELGVMMTNGTKRQIEVSTMEEAEFFARNGFDDILYAYPIIKSNAKRCKNLAESINSFHVMIDSDHGLQALLDCPLTDGKKWSVYLEVDDGSGRTGVPWDSENFIKLAQTLSLASVTDFHGLYLFNNKAYGGSGKDHLQKSGKDGAELLTYLCKTLKDNNIECNVLAIGNTPSCSQPDASMNVVTEFHPGNFIFYDTQQTTIGSCTKEEVACRLATRVIGHKPAQNMLLIDCGFLALSYDGKEDEPDKFATFQDNSDLKVLSFSQEIGKVSTVSGKKINFDSYPIDSMLYIYPWHSCATACQHTVFYAHSGDKIVDMWIPAKGW